MMRAKRSKSADVTETADFEDLSARTAVPPDDSRGDTGALRRGLIVLDAVIKAERPISSGEVAHLVGLSPSTTHRLLRVLADQGYLTRDPLKRYCPTFRSLYPAALFHPLNILRRIVHEHLIGLRQQFGQASSFVIFMGGRRWVLETVHGREVLSPYNETAVSAALHTSVAGKIYLSTLSYAERDKVLGSHPFERFTAATIVNRDVLFTQVDEIGAAGFATSFDELLDGLSAVGAPIYVEGKKIIGAIVLAGPSRNFKDEQLAVLVGSLTQVARLLSFASPEVSAVLRSLG